MKRFTVLLLCMIVLSSCFTFNAGATYYMVNSVEKLSSGTETSLSQEANTRATGLIYSYSLNLSKTGTTLYISGTTVGTLDAVRTGFKNLEIERRKTTSDSWKTYYDYGNVYRDSGGANLNTTLVVEAGYQYRISCKHYAKKNILSVQTISNTSNIVTVS